ncbi:WG repeat-containing protein [bacterium]|nr:WG repeat-containing protein [bacterium]
MKNLIITMILLLLTACTSVPAVTKTESPKARFVFSDKNGFYGLLDENGNEIVPATEYLFIDKVRDGMIPAFTKEKVFIFLDESGKKIKDVSFYDINPLYSEGLLGVADSETGKWGFVDKNLNYVIEPQFEHVGDFIDEITFAEQDGLWGMIDKTGKYILEPQFKLEEVKEKAKETLVVSKGGKIRIVDIKKAKILDVEYDKFYGMTDGKAIVGKDSSIYLNSWENNEIFLMKEPSEILYSIYFLDGNTMGNNRFHLNYREKGEKGEHFAVFDSSNGEKICDKIMNHSDEMDENCNVKERFPHKDESVKTQQAEENEQKKYGKYEEVRHGLYETSTSFKQNGKWGFLDDDGNVVIPAEYDEVTPFYLDVAWVWKGDRRFIIDRNGRIVVEIKPEWEGVTELRYTILEYYTWGLSGYCFSDRSEYWYGRECVEKRIERNKFKK